MALSFQEEVSDGVRTLYSLSFDYLAQGDVYVYAGGHGEYASQLSYRWADSTTIELTDLVQVPDGTTFYIRRIMDRTDLIHKFSNKSIRAGLIDQENYHALYLLQEFVDGFTNLDGVLTTLGNLDMLGNSINNLAYAVAASDAVPFQQMLDYLTEVDFQGVIPLLQPRQQGDGTTVTFATPATQQYLAESFFINIDAAGQRPYTDFTVNSDGSVTFDEAPPNGADIDITLFQPANVGDLSGANVTATGALESRTLGDRFADGINVKDFGATGDGTTDDTVAIQAALDYAANVAPAMVYFPRGKFMVSNILLPDSVEMKGAGYLATSIQPHPTAQHDVEYLIAHKNALSGASVGGRTAITDMFLSVGTSRRRIVYWRAWGSRLTYCLLSGGTYAGVDVTSVALDGTASNSTAVNNIFDHNWWQAGGECNFRVSDPNNRVTDGIFTNNYVSDATDYNMFIGTGAGWSIRGNHCYGCPVSINVRKGGLGTVISGNYFETDVVIDNILAGQETFTLGPGNYITHDLHANFGNSGTNIRSVGNTYGGKIYHNFNHDSKHLLMQNDVLLDSNPFVFVSGGATSRVTLTNCFLESEDVLLTSSFTGSKSNWNRPSALTYGNTNEYIVRLSTNGGGAKTASINVPSSVGASGAHILDVYLSTRQYDNGPVKQSYTAAVAFHGKSGTSTLVSTVLAENVTPSQFTTEPTFSSIDNGDGTMTLTMSWEPVDSLGYGSCLLKYA